MPVTSSALSTCWACLRVISSLSSIDSSWRSSNKLIFNGTSLLHTLLAHTHTLTHRQRESETLFGNHLFSSDWYDTHTTHLEEFWIAFSYLPSSKASAHQFRATLIATLITRAPIVFGAPAANQAHANARSGAGLQPKCLRRQLVSGARRGQTVAEVCSAMLGLGIHSDNERVRTRQSIALIGRRGVNRRVRVSVCVGDSRFARVGQPDDSEDSLSLP